MKQTGIIEIKARPAVRVNYKSKWTKRSRDYFTYMDQIRWLVKVNKPKLFSGKVKLKLVFGFKGNKRADIDNLFKGFTDPCNKLLWEDDKQIYYTSIEVRENAYDYIYYKLEGLEDERRY